MSDSDHTAHGEHGDIHLPPNSWVPISLALTMAWTFVGFLINPLVWVPGLAAVIVTLAMWFRAARNEFNDLPD